MADEMSISMFVHVWTRACCPELGSLFFKMKHGRRLAFGAAKAEARARLRASLNMVKGVQTGTE